MTDLIRLGAVPIADERTRFEVWAPNASTVDLLLADRTVVLGPDERAGTWVGIVDGVGHGDRYRFRIDDGEPLADPASGWQPDGVHGPSAVVDQRRFTWTDEDWRGVELTDTVLYELHVGTFTPAGTFDGAVGQLERVARLGVTTIELMPVNAFPGRRNWGYDGVFPSAVQESYGGPEGLARFVDAAHDRGLAVVLDVVYNHSGPEGGVHSRYGPYFTDAYQTPWGDGLNVAGPGSDHVRRTFIESATRWITDFHVDGLRLDAIDQIFDPTAKPFLEELIRAVRAAGRRSGRTVLTFVESAANNPEHVRPLSRGGIDADGAWDDDVHHALRVALTGDTRGYYVDYQGVADLAEAYVRRWVFTGRYSVYRERHHGKPADDVDRNHFVAFSSNHDHVGNTPNGARPPFDHRQRLVAAAAVVLSPFTPMLFMGEEYGETHPFPYFVDHADPELIEAVRKGHAEEFSRFEWSEPIADPADPATFESAILDPSVAAVEPHRSVLAAYTELLSLRRLHGVLHDPDAEQRVQRIGDAIVVERRLDDTRSVLILNLGDGPLDLEIDVMPILTTVGSAERNQVSEESVPAQFDVAFDAGEARWAGGTGGCRPAIIDANSVHLDGTTAVLLIGQ